LLSTILILLGSFALVFISSLLFINALEWIGHHLKLGSSFVGAILSPVFTSLPELIVILIAIFSNLGSTGSEIGIGTIFGEPFMASSLSYGLVGIAVIIGYFAKRRDSSTLVIDKTLAVPYIFVIILFPLTLIPGFIHATWLRYLFGLMFLVFFIFYVQLMFRRRKNELIEESEELILAKFLPESISYQRVGLSVQILAAAVLLFIGSRYLVSSVAAIAEHIQVSPMGLAIIIIPAATAIPETITAIIWGFKGKDTMSIGSLVGEKILYCTFYPALGLFLTSWVLDIHAVFSVIVTSIISLILLVFILKQKLPWYGLLIGLIAFITYGVLVFAFRF
jgi:cation:H+ antiporter